MLEAKVYIYIEPILPFSTKARYITDISPEKGVCSLTDLLNILKADYQIPVQVTEDIKIHIRCGTCIIVDLLEKKYFKINDNPSVILSKIALGQTPSVGGAFAMLERENRKVEAIVNNKYFNK